MGKNENDDFVVKAIRKYESIYPDLPSEFYGYCGLVDLKTREEENRELATLLVSNMQNRLLVIRRISPLMAKDYLKVLAETTKRSLKTCGMSSSENIEAQAVQEYTQVLDNYFIELEKTILLECNCSVLLYLATFYDDAKFVRYLSNETVRMAFLYPVIKQFE